MFKFVVVALMVSYVVAEHSAIVKIAGEKVQGTVTFTKTEKGIQVDGSISGLTPGNHGFHIHQKGDITKGCGSTGGHFNPFNKNHGALDAKESHVGDLGNIKADDKGVANISILTNKIALEGETCIVGRAVVVHDGEDDLGLGGHNDSLTTGNAGGRAGCGVIGILSENSSMLLSPVYLTIIFSVLASLVASKY